jgi:hypothetical protein
MLKRPSNKPRDVIEPLARQAIVANGGADLARIWFKFDCATCGERCVCPEPNLLPLKAVCEVCGATTAIRGAGFALQVRRSTAIDWDKPATTLVVRKRYASDQGDA